MFEKGSIPWNKGKINMKICKCCGKEFRLVKSRMERNIYCSLACKTLDSKYSHVRKKPCIVCGKPIQCRSTRCRSCSQSGELSAMWKGGITPINKRIRMSLQFKNWRNSVFKRDDYTCQICGQHGGVIHPNHIKKFSDYIDKRFFIDNGITLCEHCHISLVNHHEHEWESYFYFNLETRSMSYGQERE